MIQEVPLAQLRASPLNPRKRFDDASIDELADSIATEGLLQNLVVRPSPDEEGVYEIAAGERRLRAMLRLDNRGQWPRDRLVPVVVRDLTDLQLLQLATTENLARQDMTPMEEARAFQQMLDLGSDVDTIAAETGFSLATVKKRLALLKLTDKAIEALEAGELSLGAAQAMTIAPADTQERLLQWGSPSAADVRRTLQQGTIPVSRAKFPRDWYDGAYVEQSIFDPDAEPRFADADLFHKLQKKWAEQLAKKYRETWGWVEVTADYYRWQYDKAKKGTSLKDQGVVIEVDPYRGELEVHEGLVKKPKETYSSSAGAKQEKDPLALTKKHKERIHAEFERAAQAALADNRVASLALLTYTLLQPYSSETITISHAPSGDRPSRRLDGLHDTAREYLDRLNLGPKTRQALTGETAGSYGHFDDGLLSELLATRISDLLGLVTIIVGLSLRAGERWGTGGTQAQFTAIWRLLEPQYAPSKHLSTWRDLGADWLQLYSKARLQQVAAQLCGPEVAAELESKPKKQTIAQILQRAGERLDQVPDELQLPPATLAEAFEREGNGNDVDEDEWDEDLEEEEAVA